MRAKLTLKQSIPLGIGSIMGSGVLFLPSLTYNIALNDVILSWFLIILLCIPGVIFFSDMLEATSSKEASMANLVELGLGKDIANSTYILLLGTVIFGMPSASIIAGKYVGEVFYSPVLSYCIPFLILSVSFIVNLKGIESSSRVATLITALILIFSVALIVLTTKTPPHYQVLKPSFNIGNIYQGSVLAFWAFAGFENLTFLYDQFKNPKRDLMITIAVSILFCGIIYIFLVANYAASIPLNQINSTIGLLQLAESTNTRSVALIISGFAFFAVLINFISWTSGILQLMAKSAKKNIIHKKFIYCFKGKKSPLILLYIIFALNTFLGLISPNIFEKILQTVSSNFLILYAMLIGSYFIFSKNIIKKTLALAMTLVLIVTISSSGALLIYPLILFIVSVFHNAKQRIREGTH